MPSETAREVTFEGIAPNGAELSLKLIVMRANGRQGMLRTLLTNSANEQEKAKMGSEELPAESSIESLADYILHTTIYPACVSCVIEHSGFSNWPITFEQFCELPEEFVASWEEAAFGLNPHWILVSAEKKVKTPNGGTRRRRKHSSSTKEPKSISTPTPTKVT